MELVKIGSDSFGDALRTGRRLRNLPFSTVAKWVGATRDEVESWELGKAMPSSDQLHMLLQHFPEHLEEFRALLLVQGFMEAPSDEKVLAAARRFVKDASHPEGEEAAPESQPIINVDEYKGMRFFRALKKSRKFHGLTFKEYGARAGLHGSSISHWEKQTHQITKENYEKLIEAYPELSYASPPRFGTLGPKKKRKNGDPTPTVPKPGLVRLVPLEQRSWVDAFLELKQRPDRDEVVALFRDILRGVTPEQFIKLLE